MLGTPMRRGATAALWFAMTGSAEAQSGLGTLTGVVRVDSTREPLRGAGVLLPSLERIALADSLGRFVLHQITPGTHRVVVRHLGFRPLSVYVTFTGDTVEREFTLVHVVPRLDTVSVQRSAVIPSFEEHRAIGLGVFITRAELEPQEGRKLSEVIGQIRGIRLEHRINGRAYVVSSRRALGRGGGPCRPPVYVNNQMIFYSRPGEEPFDINSVLVGQIEAIEFYSGPATTPARYSRLQSDCGVLVIHTRRAP